MKKDILIEKLVKIAKTQQVLLKELSKYSQRINLVDQLNETFKYFFHKLSKIAVNNKNNESFYLEAARLSTYIRNLEQADKHIQMCAQFIDKYSNEIKELEEFKPFANWFFLTLNDLSRAPLHMQEMQDLNNLMRRHIRR